MSSKLKLNMLELVITTSPGGGWWVLDFTRLMLISTQVEVVVEVGVELGNKVFLLFHLWLQS